MNEIRGYPQHQPKLSRFQVFCYFPPALPTYTLCVVLKSARLGRQNQPLATNLSFGRLLSVDANTVWQKLYAFVNGNRGAGISALYLDYARRNN